MTSYHDELVQMMKILPRRISKSSHGILPSSVHPTLRPFDPLADPSHVFLAPLIHLILACVILSRYSFMFLAFLLLSTYHLFRDSVLYLLTSWRVDMLTAPQPGERTRQREYASSISLSMEDVRKCQRAFSGSFPGSENGRRTDRKKHVTVNDVVCSVMADVLGEELSTKAENASSWARIRRRLRLILPSPIAFFM